MKPSVVASVITTAILLTGVRPSNAQGCFSHSGFSHSVAYAGTCYAFSSANAGFLDFHDVNCFAHGLLPVKVTNEAVHNVLVKQLLYLDGQQGAKDHWIGLAFFNGNWTYDDHGTQLLPEGYDQWASGTDVEGLSQRGACAAMVGPSYDWGIRPCVERKRYICQKRIELPSCFENDDVGTSVRYRDVCYTFSSRKAKFLDFHDVDCYGLGLEPSKVKSATTHMVLKTHLLYQATQGDALAYWIGLAVVNGNWAYNDAGDDQLEDENSQWASGVDVAGLSQRGACAAMKPPGYDWDIKACVERHNYICQKDIPLTPCYDGDSSVVSALFNGKCYLIPPSGDQFNSYVRTSCSNYGAVPVLDKDADIHALLVRLIERNQISGSDVWIGLAYTNDEWTFNDQTTLGSFTTWADGQNTGSPQSPNTCVALGESDDFDWVIQDCTTRNRFICERLPPTPEPPTATACVTAPVTNPPATTPAAETAPTGCFNHTGVEHSVAYAGTCYTFSSANAGFLDFHDVNCYALGLLPVKVTNEAVHNVLVKQLLYLDGQQGAKDHWIGLAFLNGNWTYDDQGTQLLPADYNQWASGTDVDGLSRRGACAAMVGPSYDWGIKPCVERKRYICQKRIELPSCFQNDSVSTSVAYRDVCYTFSTTKAKFLDFHDVDCYGLGLEPSKVKSATTHMVLQTHLLHEATQGDALAYWIGLAVVNGNWAYNDAGDDQLEDENSQWASGVDVAGLSQRGACAAMKPPGYDWDIKACVERHNYICQKDIPLTPCYDGDSAVVSALYNGKCYLIPPSGDQFNSYVRTSCSNYGAVPVLDKDADIHALLVRLIERNQISGSDVWIGLAYTNDEWTFIDQTTLTNFDTWADGQNTDSPQSPNTCVALGESDDFNWVIQDCTTRNRYICERLPPTPAPRNHCKLVFYEFNDDSLRIDGVKYHAAIINNSRTTPSTAATTAQQPNTTASTAATTTQQARTTASTAATTAQQPNTTASTAATTTQQARTTASTGATTTQQPNTTASTAATTTQQPNTTASTAATTTQQARTTASTAATTIQQPNTTASTGTTTTQQARTTISAGPSTAATTTQQPNAISSTAPNTTLQSSTATATISTIPTSISTKVTTVPSTTTLVGSTTITTVRSTATTQTASATPRTTARDLKAYVTAKFVAKALVWIDAYGVRNSPEFKDLKERIETKLNKEFKERLGRRFKRWFVTRFSQGSVIVDSLVEVEPTQDAVDTMAGSIVESLRSQTLGADTNFNFTEIGGTEMGTFDHLFQATFDIDPDVRSWSEELSRSNSTEYSELQNIVVNNITTVLMNLTTVVVVDSFSDATQFPGNGVRAHVSVLTTNLTSLENAKYILTAANSSQDNAPYSNFGGLSAVLVELVYHGTTTQQPNTTASTAGTTTQQPTLATVCTPVLVNNSSTATPSSTSPADTSSSSGCFSHADVSHSVAYAGTCYTFSSSNTNFIGFHDADCFALGLEPVKVTSEDVHNVLKKQLLYLDGELGPKEHWIALAYRNGQWVYDDEGREVLDDEDSQWASGVDVDAESVPRRCAAMAPPTYDWAIRDCVNRKRYICQKRIELPSDSVNTSVAYRDVCYTFSTTPDKFLDFHDVNCLAIGFEAVKVKSVITHNVLKTHLLYLRNSLPYWIGLAVVNGNWVYDDAGTQLLDDEISQWGSGVDETDTTPIIRCAAMVPPIYDWDVENCLADYNYICQKDIPLTPCFDGDSGVISAMYNGKCYLIPPSRDGYNDYVDTRCANYSAVPVLDKDAEIHALLVRLIERNNISGDDFWIGLSYSNDEWTFNDQTTLASFDTWADGQNTGSPQSPNTCVALGESDDFNWVIQDCTTRNRFICEQRQCTGYRCFISQECISYVKYCNGVPDCADGTDELCRSDEPLGVCQPITPSAEFICTHLLPYENTSLPNYLNQTTQTGSIQTAFALNRASGCHPSFSFLMCTTLFPKCEDDQQTPPCQELCDEVQASCEASLQAIGEEWPRSCADLPSRNDEECLEPTPGACEPFPQALQSTCEPLTGYNSTSFPNAFGHLSFQEMITSREYFLFGSVLGNISTSCYPNVYTAFCRMFLPQCENGMQIQVCRSVCEEINASCTPVGLGLPFSCDVFPDQENDPTCSLVGQPPAGCEPIRYSRCMGLSYSQTSFPNIFQWPTQEFALQNAPFVFPTFDPISDCHPDLDFFLCSLFFPQCTPEGQISLCRSLCYEINATCGERALAAGIQWDASICPRLPDSNCTLPNASRITTPAGTTTISPSTPTPTSRTTEASPDCVPIPFDRCQNLSYSETSFPNWLGWQGPEDAIGNATSIFGALDQISDCHKDLELFLCALYFPSCTATGPKFPCRSFCDEINSACAVHALTAGIPWDIAGCTTLPASSYEEGCIVPEGLLECVPVPYDRCQNMSYSATSFPNWLGWQGPEDAIGNATSIFGALDQISDCHKDLELFLCSLYFPSCTLWSGVKFPCRSFCDEINDACAEAALSASIPWDTSGCTTLPASSYEGDCIAPEETCDGWPHECFGSPGSCVGAWQFCDGDRFCPYNDDESICSSYTCMPIELEFCQDEVPYNRTTFPNYLGQQNVTMVEESDIHANVSLLSDTACHEYVKFLYCHMAVPECVRDGVRGQPLCRTLCEEVRQTCSREITEIGFEFTKGTCESIFPDSVQKDTCKLITEFDCSFNVDTCGWTIGNNSQVDMLQPRNNSNLGMYLSLDGYSSKPTSPTMYTDNKCLKLGYLVRGVGSRLTVYVSGPENYMYFTWRQSSDDDEDEKGWSTVSLNINKGWSWFKVALAADVADDGEVGVDDVTLSDGLCEGQVSPGCEKIEFQRCLSMPYNVTTYPNLLGWGKSLAMSLAPGSFQAFDQIADCHRDLHFYLCSVIFPECTPTGTRLPCRSFCENVTDACAARANVLSLGWDPNGCVSFPEADDPQGCVAPKGGCEPIRYSRCTGLSYSQTSFPNLVQWSSQPFALGVAPTVFPSYDNISDCHPDLNFFLCSILFPQCTSEGQILPCRSFCYEINDTCGERALALGLDWQDSICPTLPEEDCLLPDAPPTTVSAALNRENRQDFVSDLVQLLKDDLRVVRKVLRSELSLTRQWLRAYLNHSSEEFKELRAEIKENALQAFSNIIDDLLGVTVKSLRQGSVVAELIIATSSNNLNDLAVTLTDAVSSGSFGNLTVDNTSLTVEQFDFLLEGFFYLYDTPWNDVYANVSTTEYEELHNDVHLNVLEEALHLEDASVALVKNFTEENGYVLADLLIFMPNRSVAIEKYNALIAANMTGRFGNLNGTLFHLDDPRLYQLEPCFANRFQFSYGYNGICYVFVNESLGLYTNFEDFNIACSRLGGIPVYVTDNVTHDFLVFVIQTDKSLTGSDFGVGVQWNAGTALWEYWDNSDVLIEELWVDSYDPSTNPAITDHCVAMSPTGTPTYGWDPAPCESFDGYICQLGIPTTTPPPTTPETPQFDIEPCLTDSFDNGYAYNDVCYVFFNESVGDGRNINFEDFKIACDNVGAVPVYVSNRTTHDFLAFIIRNSKNSSLSGTAFGVGIGYDPPVQAWEYSDGSEVIIDQLWVDTYNPASRPTDLRFCAAMDPSGTPPYGWNPEVCADLQGYICQKPIPPPVIDCMAGSFVVMENSDDILMDQAAYATAANNITSQLMDLIGDIEGFTDLEVAMLLDEDEESDSSEIN
ncbi:CORIN [Branchiostoma lanceolatum]|uniref:CORIN protein n=1 Tax=Branchiostoma lanceolatum TaxID=7740 RepID=A0A8K0EHX8_BRALA|nr:CORIN [Branchiostoma lanceolatum]